MPLMCETGGITPYVPTSGTPWDKYRALHLYRRIGFGASPNDIDSAVAQDPLDVIDAIVDAAAALAPSPPPEWAYWTANDYTDIINEIGPQYEASYLQFVNDMINNGLRDKLTLFWHNHFVAILDVYTCPSYQYQYYNLLQSNVLGNFKDFTHAIGLTPAMLIFLNGALNTNEEPNENYARELYELFTLGQDNGYTQTDIEETARALTGYVDLDFVNFCGPIEFDANFFDDGEKTIFGQTGNWGYDDVIDILFEQRGEQVANFICSKIYGYFVSPEIDEEIVSALAQTFIDNDWELVPVFKQLFKSEHFFDNNINGVVVKSPFEMLLTFANDSNLGFDDEIIEAFGYIAATMGQQLFDPVDVAGWQGNHDWINSNTLTARWQIMEAYIYWALDNDLNSMMNLVTDIISESNDPYQVTQLVVDHFIPQGLQTVEMYEQATVAFKWEVPENYFATGVWNLTWTDTVPYQMAFLLIHIIKLPEFQLS